MSNRLRPRCAPKRRKTCSRPISAWSSSVPSEGSARRLVMPLVIGSPTRSWPTAAWETAVSSGALSHMPPDRARLYARLYRGIQMMRDFQTEAHQYRPRLTALGFDRTLTEPEKAEYLNVLGQLDQFSLRMAALGPQLFDPAAK